MDKQYNPIEVEEKMGKNMVKKEKFQIKNLKNLFTGNTPAKCYWHTPYGT